MSDQSGAAAVGRPMTRREALGYLSLASLLALLGVGLRAGLRFALPTRPPGEYGGVLTLGPASDLPPAGAAPLNMPEGRFWLVNTDEGVLALHKACTHLDCLCDWDEQTREFICPCHGSRFAANGLYLAGPAARSLDRFVVQLLDDTGAVVAETDPARGAPLPLMQRVSTASSLAVSGAEAGGAAERAELAEEDAAASQTWIIAVDTGRKIPGTVPGRA